MQTQANQTGWAAGLTLGFQSINSRTVLTQRRHHGPLLVQRPFYPEDSVCHVYLVHPPGGVVGGDTIDINVTCHEGAEALVTTPAAGKFYRSNGKIALQNIRSKVDPHATLEWLPLENILFDHARVNSSTRFDLANNSKLVGWDIICLGRPACNETFAHGQMNSKLEVWYNNQPLLLERMVFNSETIRSVCGLMDHSVVGTMLIYPADTDDLETVRKTAEKHRFFGVTLIDKLLVCRMLGSQGGFVRELFTEIWTLLRPKLKQCYACSPRVWAT